MGNYVKWVRVVKYPKGILGDPHIYPDDCYGVDLVAHNGVVLTTTTLFLSRVTAIKKAAGLACQLGVPVVQKCIKSLRDVRW